jgi:hypothetical protein
MSREMGNLVVKVDVKENMEEGLMMASAKLLEAWIRSGKEDSSRIRQMGLSGLVLGYPSNLDALSAKISLSQGARPMTKFSGKAS